MSLSLSYFIVRRYWPVICAPFCLEWRLTTRYYLEVIMQTLPCQDMQALTVYDLDRWWTSIKVAYNAPTANKILTRCKNVFKTAKRWAVITDNVAVDLERAEEEGREYPPFADEKRRLLFEEASTRLRPYVWIGAYTGQRRKSIALLQKSDVDLGENDLLFRKTKQKKVRRVPIHPDLWPIIGELLSIPLTHKDREQSPFLLPQYKDYRTISRSFYRLVRKKRVGLAGFRYHDLRHNVGTRMTDAGINNKTIMEVLGHSTVAMTAKYSHPSRATMRKAIEDVL